MSAVTPILKFENVRKQREIAYVVGPYGFSCRKLATTADGSLTMVRVSGSRRIFATCELWGSREDAIAAYGAKMRVDKGDRPSPYPARKPVDVFALRLPSQVYADTDIETVAA
jgi:hypothetical protein